MALEPITRQEKIIAGQDLEPITRMEMFLKNFGGGGGSGGAFVVTITEIGGKTYSADKTFEEIVSAVEKGQNVIAKKIDGVITAFLPLLSVAADTLVAFEHMQYQDYNNTIIDEKIAIMKDNNVQVVDTVLNVTTS